VSLQFVRALELEIKSKINNLTGRVMNGTLSDHEYIRMTAAVVAYKEVLSLARAVLKRLGEDDEGEEGEDVIPARGGQPRG